MRKYLFTAAAALAVAACSSNASAPNTTLPSTPGLTSQSTALSQNAEDSGDVFTQTNSPDGNRVLRYHRLADGHLSFAGAFATGGTGAGAAILGPKLSPSHTVQLARDHTLLYAVDAGSNDIAAFAISGGGLTLIGRFPAHGSEPVSIAVIRSLLYVLNVKSNDISGFSIDSTGALHYIAGSTQPLSGIAGQDGPVDLRFADSDSVLIAAEKFANILDTFTLTNGRANHAVAHMSAGPTPFGMAVREDGLVVDTEASNDVPHASAVSSYRVSSGGTLTTLTASLHNGQSASCWAAFTPDQRFIYITNTASSTLSEYAVAPSGTLSLIHAIAAAEAPNSAPTDLGVSSDGEFVYVVNQMAHTLRAFSRDADGSLDTLQTVAGLPASAVGIAVH